MARHIPSLNALRVFEAAARHMSFTQAAEELCVTQGAVSRQIKALEEELGVALFRRLTRALEITEYGTMLWPPVRDALDQMERATLRIKGHGGTGVLTISVLPTFAMKWLIPRLTDFSESHPTIEVHMATSIRPVNFAREDIDVAIRVGMPVGEPSDGAAPRIDLTMVENWEGIYAERIMPDELLPVCAPDLVDLDNPLTDPNDLERFTLLHNATRPNAWLDWLRAVEAGKVDGRSGPAYGHFFMTLQAAVQGLGIALVPRVLAADDLSAGRLVVAINRGVESAGAYYLLCRHHHRDLPKIRAFRQWLLHAIAHDDGQAVFPLEQLQ